MNRDPNRAARADADGERHTVSITRMCLRSGSIQLPFALSGRLPQGELLAHDVESDEPVMLWSDPPRTLAGLGPLFEAHEIQVNDQLVLDLDGDDLRLGVRKRPRRSRPQVTPSTWSSHRTPDGPAPDGVAPAVDEGRSPDADEGSAWRTTEPGPAVRDEADPPHGDLGDVAGWDRYRETAAAPPEEQDADRSYEDPGDDDAPRAPRVRVSPLPRNTATTADGHRERARDADGSARRSRPRGSDERGDRAGGVFGGAWRAAKSLFGRGSEERPSEVTSPEGEPDWVRAWDDDPGADDPRLEDVAPSAFDEGPGGTYAGHEDDEPEWRRAEPYDDLGHTQRDAPARHEPAGWHSSRRRDEDVDAPSADAMAVDARAGTDPSAEDDDDLRPSRDEPLAPAVGWDDVPPAGDDLGASWDRRADAADGYEADGYEDVEREDEVAHAPASDAGASRSDAEEAEEAIDDEASERARVHRAAAWRDEGGVPSRAERFLGGDLRTRLLRFLTSPEMPLIAKTEMIASRFDLPADVAGELLEDIAQDPPPGFRLTPVRAGAWRIERTGT